MTILESGRKNIVVLGAGFGGITALLKLRSWLKKKGLAPGYNLVLVNKNGQHLYTPALYEIASIPRGEADAVCLKSAVCIQIEDILERFPEIRFIGEEVEKLDPRTHILTFKSGNQLSFEYAIIALGAETNFFNIPGLVENTLALKTFEDAIRLRNKVEELARNADGAGRIVVGGAGPTGVELSAEFVNFACRIKEKLGGTRCREEITLVDASPEILPGFGPDIVRRTRKRLLKLGVKIKTGFTIKKVSPAEIAGGNREVLPYKLLIWAGGVRPAAILKNFNLPLDPKGGLLVNEFLEVKPRIYAVGDCVSSKNEKTGVSPQRNVPVAESQARVAARNVIADITGKRKRVFRPLANYPYVLAVGGKYALTDLVIVKFFGFFGWVLKQLVELRYLLFVLPAVKAARMWLRGLYYATRND